MFLTDSTDFHRLNFQKPQAHHAATPKAPLTTAAQSKVILNLFQDLT
jgi:hypothetical protein